MALAIDSQEVGSAGHRSGFNASSLTWTFNNTAGNLLIVGIVVSGTAGAKTITSVTYNTVNMGAAAASVSWSTAFSLVSIYALLTPATGSNTVAVTVPGGDQDILGGAISFSGATGTGLTSTNTDAGGTGTHATAGAITAASGNYVLGVGGWGSGSAATADHASTFTLVGTGTTAGDDIATDIAQSAGSAINPGFTWTGADHWGMAALEIQGLAAAASGPPFMPGRMPLGA